MGGGLKAEASGTRQLVQSYRWVVDEAEQSKFWWLRNHNVG